MTTSDPAGAGLDPVHVLAICNAADRSGRDQQAFLLAAPGSVRAFLPSRRMARDACATLARTGYEAAVGGSGRRGGRDVVVTGWSPAGLDSRLAAMRGIVHHLADNPSVTALAVIERFRELPAGSASPLAGVQVLDQARARLDAWVSARCGIRAPIHPAAMPADVGIALRLRAAQVLEQAIDDLIERHFRVAGHALAQFSALRPQMSGDRAQQAAIRQAGIVFHLPGSTADQSSVLNRNAPGRPGAGAPPLPGRVSRTGAGPWPRGVREFPAPGPSLSSRPAAATPGRPLERRPPAGGQCPGC